MAKIRDGGNTQHKEEKWSHANSHVSQGGANITSLYEQMLLIIDLTHKTVEVLNKKKHIRLVAERPVHRICSKTLIN
jgi:hypothetical protein